jgi:2-haloacid dehalogenase
MNLGEIHGQALDALLAKHRLASITPAQRRWMLGAWALGKPWSDTVAGLARIKRHVPIASLSNGSVAQMVGLARHAGLPWDCIFSAEFFKAYKPAPQVYLGACAYLACAPEQMMLCAAHNYDLAAAAALGLKTAFIPRPAEFGPMQKKDFSPEGPWTVVARDLNDLADQLEGMFVPWRDGAEVAV